MSFFFVFLLFGAAAASPAIHILLVNEGDGLVDYVSFFSVSSALLHYPSSMVFIWYDSAAPPSGVFSKYLNDHPRIKFEEISSFRISKNAETGALSVLILSSVILTKPIGHSTLSAHSSITALSPTSICPAFLTLNSVSSVSFDEVRSQKSLSPLISQVAPTSKKVPSELLCSIDESQSYQALEADELWDLHPDAIGLWLPLSPPPSLLWLFTNPRAIVSRFIVSASFSSFDAEAHADVISSRFAGESTDAPSASPPPDLALLLKNDSVKSVIDLACSFPILMLFTSNYSCLHPAIVRVPTAAVENPNAAFQIFDFVHSPLPARDAVFAVGVFEPLRAAERLELLHNIVASSARVVVLSQSEFANKMMEFGAAIVTSPSSLVVFRRDDFAAAAAGMISSSTELALVRYIKKDYTTFRRRLEDLWAIARSFEGPVEGSLFSIHNFDAFSSTFYAKQCGFVAALEGRKRLLEIGFNAGFSALLALASNDDIVVHAVDLGEHSYTTRCFEYLQGVYGQRVHLKIGSSFDVVPLMGGGFDAAHVDGDHSVAGMVRDFRNVASKLLIGGVIIFDDTNIVDFANYLLGEFGKSLAPLPQLPQGVFAHTVAMLIAQPRREGVADFADVSLLIGELQLK